MTVSRGWAKVPAGRLQVSLSCAVLCQIVSLQYLSRSSLHRLASLPCHIFLSLWSPSGDKRGLSVVFEADDMPCPGPFPFSYIADYTTQNLLRIIPLLKDKIMQWSPYRNMHIYTKLKTTLEPQSHAWVIPIVFELTVCTWNLTTPIVAFWESFVVGLHVLLKG